MRTTIVRLLSSMASAKEISQYLKRFSQLDAKRFAVVKVGGAVLRDDLDALTSSLSFVQEVGLTPIVLHGAGPQLDAERVQRRRHRQAGHRRIARDAAGRRSAIVRRVFQQWKTCASVVSSCRLPARARPRSPVRRVRVGLPWTPTEVRAGRPGREGAYLAPASTRRSRSVRSR